MTTRIVVEHDKRDQADWWCKYNKIPSTWGRCIMDTSPLGMSFLYEFPKEFETEATVFQLKFA